MPFAEANPLLPQGFLFVASEPFLLRSPAESKRIRINELHLPSPSRKLVSRSTRSNLLLASPSRKSVSRPTRSNQFRNRSTDDEHTHDLAHLQKPTSGASVESNSNAVQAVACVFGGQNGRVGIGAVRELPSSPMETWAQS